MVVIEPRPCLLQITQGRPTHLHLSPLAFNYEFKTGSVPSPQFLRIGLSKKRQGIQF